MTWTSVEHRILDLSPSAEQGRNLSDLVAELRVVTPPREVTKNPYNNSISLHWERYEIETDADGFETCQFSDNGTIIHHWPHIAGATIATELVEQVKFATN